MLFGSSDISVADQLEFDSWQEEQKQLAYNICGKPESSETLWYQAYNTGYARGYAAGLERGKRVKAP